MEYGNVSALLQRFQFHKQLATQLSIFDILLMKRNSNLSTKDHAKSFSLVFYKVTDIVSLPAVSGTAVLQLSRQKVEIFKYCYNIWTHFTNKTANDLAVMLVKHMHSERDTSVTL